MNMNSPLLAAKLHIPTPRPDLVARPRLFQKLDQALTRPLTLLSAPPGFGKTTLVSAWLSTKAEGGRMKDEGSRGEKVEGRRPKAESRGQEAPDRLDSFHPSSFMYPALRVAWLSLDERDNDVARFMMYLVAALETVQAGVGQQALNRLRSRRKLPLEAAMTLLSNNIVTMPEFLLVLDDYHVIELQAIHEAMAFLLDRLPPPMHLILATRTDPPFPLARLRARDQLVELRAPDLRFGPEEAAAFLNDRMGLGLTPEQIAALDARAEGWIAGLQLAALSLRGRQDIAEFVRAFAGSQHFVLDYLTEEVLQRQTPDIQTFLLQTSILDQMNAALADAVTGRTDSLQILAQLEKANLFIIPLDEAHRWYRYHHLFADLLQSRLQQSHPEQLPDLHRRASVWYEQNGQANEAVEHALAIPDFNRAAHLIEQVGLALVLRSEVTTLLNWISPLPDEVILSRPFLCLIQAAALTMTGKIESGAARLALVDDAALDPFARAMAALLRPVLALLRADIPNAIESARRALQAAEASTANPADPQAEFNTIATVYIALFLAELQIIAGQIRAAAATCRRGLEMGNAIPRTSAWAIVPGFTHYVLAELLYEWNEHEVAAQEAEQCLQICRAAGNEEFESYVLVTLAQIQQARGYADKAYWMVQQAVRLEHQRNIAGEVRFVAPRLAQVLIAQGRLDEAAQFVQELPPEDEIVWDAFERGLAPIARARVLIAQREFDQAVRVLEPLQEAVETAAQMGRLIEILALLALAWQELGDTARARTALMRALSLAEPEGYVRTFVDLGEKMEFLISDFRFRIEKEGNRRLLEYVNRLLAAFPLAHAASSHKSEIINLKSEIPEPLSERELAVLRLIAEGLSNQEIADRLVVAISTVKTHINNIYGKLGAGSRIQAVERARERGLLPL